MDLASAGVRTRGDLVKLRLMTWAAAAAKFQTTKRSERGRGRFDLSNNHPITSLMSGSSPVLVWN